MTRKEAMRQNQQTDTLRALGFTAGEAEQLRRISMTLHRWYEGECGTDRACIVRGRWDREKGEFIYDADGPPHWELAGGSGKGRYIRTPDREKGAVARLKAIIAAQNARISDPNSKEAELHIHATCAAKLAGSVGYYLQTDPRGAALYILRPGDVPDGGEAGSYYNRGICVY